MTTSWMIRSGKGGMYVDEFLEKKIVAIGWKDIGDLAAKNQEQIVDLVKRAYPHYHPSATANTASMLFRFTTTIQAGDRVVTYDSERRIYHLGRVTGAYKYAPNLIPALPQTRSVQWDREVGRDSLATPTRNVLGATLTLFRIPDEETSDLERGGGGKRVSEAVVGDLEAVVAETVDDTAERSLELIKDMILELDEEEMEELMASVLRAMGYKARVSKKGPDRGVDVTASPDGLGLEQPRIKAEVKHRPNTQMGAPEIRNFIGTLRPGDSGLYLSTGGFSKESRYEAERSNVPVTLINLDDLVRLITENYSKFDDLGRVLVPLVSILWPAKEDR